MSAPFNLGVIGDQAASSDHKFGNHKFAALVPPVYRGSTVVFDTLDEFVSRKSRLPDGYTYGTTGTPTHRSLERRIAELDKGHGAVLAPSGQAAICLVLLTWLRAGDHLLMTDACYGPARSFALDVLKGMGVDVQLYSPRASAAELQSMLRPSTRMVWLESPGSLTLEVQDIEAIAAVAHNAGVLTAVDNTWASPLGCSPLALGVDLCVHACTKYMSGHSDVLMGSVSTRRDDLYQRLRVTQAQMGQAPGAEDCYMVWRGLQTLELRWTAQCAAALQIAEYLAAHRSVAHVIFPALKNSPDHALWLRQYRGCGSVISFVLTDPDYQRARTFFNSLMHFAIGASWGGVHSLAAYYPAAELEKRIYSEIRTPVVRLSIGLEPVSLLLEDLERALVAFDQSLKS